MIKSSEEILYALRDILGGYVGKVFTMGMKTQIWTDAAEIRNAAHSEGQAMMSPWACSNANTSYCIQCEDEKGLEDYDFEICLKCHSAGGFSI